MFSFSFSSSWIISHTSHQLFLHYSVIRWCRFHSNFCGSHYRWVHLVVLWHGPHELVTSFICLRWPLELLSKKLFSKASVTPKDLFSVMQLVDLEPSSSCGVEELLCIQKLHHEFFNGPLKNTIFQWSNEQRIEFLFFCTGYKHLPHDEEFNIKVNFNLDSGHLPLSHTCVPELRLPRDAYNGDITEFRKQIELAMDWHKDGLMTMN